MCIITERRFIYFLLLTVFFLITFILFTYISDATVTLSPSAPPPPKSYYSTKKETYKVKSKKDEDEWSAITHQGRERLKALKREVDPEEDFSFDSMEQRVDDDPMFDGRIDWMKGERPA